MVHYPRFGRISKPKHANAFISSPKSSFVVRDFPPERKRIDIGDYYADDRLFRRLTGWQPRVALAEGLARSLDFYRAHLAHYL